MNHNDNITLKIGGKKYFGWTKAVVEKSIRQMAGSFGLTTTDVYPGEPRKWDIAMGDECIVEINDQKVITGYIEDILTNYDDTDHNIQFGGRDKTGDLIDCSYNEEAKEWKGLSVAAVIKKLCDPFNIDVVIDSSVSSDVNTVWKDNIKANEGDTVFDLILKVCQMKAVLPVSYSDGKLTLTRAGTGYKATDLLQTGVNILSGSFDQSNKDRYQTYIVKGQGVGKDSKTTLQIFTGPVGQTTDSVINRYRPIIIFTETPCDSGLCLERAKWEMSNRAGASRSLTYKVQGWTQSDGKVWPLNAMVQVKDDKFGVSETLLISELSFAVDESSGSVTTMKLVHPDSMKPNPTAQKVKTGFDWIR